MTGWTMRLTYPGEADDHFQIHLAGRQIGTIFCSPNAPGRPWFWSLNCFHDARATQRGYAPTMEAAREQVRHWHEHALGLVPAVRWAVEPSEWQRA